MERSLAIAALLLAIGGCAETEKPTCYKIVESVTTEAGSHMRVPRSPISDALPEDLDGTNLPPINVPLFESVSLYLPFSISPSGMYITYLTEL